MIPLYRSIDIYGVVDGLVDGVVDGLVEVLFVQLGLNKM